MNFCTVLSKQSKENERFSIEDGLKLNNRFRGFRGEEISFARNEQHLEGALLKPYSLAATNERNLTPTRNVFFVLFYFFEAIFFYIEAFFFFFKTTSVDDGCKGERRENKPTHPLHHFVSFVKAVLPTA